MSDHVWSVGFEDGFNAYIFHDVEVTNSINEEYSSGFKAGVEEAKRQCSGEVGECAA